MREGMLVLSGDVLLLFNPLQIDAQFSGAAAISIKEPVETGKDHGVFLNDGNGYVKNFLHKQTEETLRTVGAVNEQGTVDLDTGAILMSAEMLQALYGLISTEGKPDFPDKDGDYNITIPYISPTILIPPLEFFSQLCYSIQDRAINV